MPVSVPSASLEGKTALVTGGSRGIGRGIALELARRGASVVINYATSTEQAEAVVAELEAAQPADVMKNSSGRQAAAIKADLSKLTEISRLFSEAKSKFGKLDIVVSNSGIEAWNKTEEITEEQYDSVFNLNAKAQFFVGQAAFKHLEQDGRIVLMSSIAAGLMGVRDHALYNASKMAVIGMVKSFATDFGVKGITVNAIAPGGVKSDMFADNAWHYIPGATADWDKTKIEDVMAQACPLQRCGEPDDIARAVAFLVSRDGGWVNGQVLTLAGGASQ